MVSKVTFTSTTLAFSSILSLLALALLLRNDSCVLHLRLRTPAPLRGDLGLDHNVTSSGRGRRRRRSLLLSRSALLRSRW